MKTITKLLKMALLTTVCFVVLFSAISCQAASKPKFPTSRSYEIGPDEEYDIVDGMRFPSGYKITNVKYSKKNVVAFEIYKSQIMVSARRPGTTTVTFNVKKGTKPYNYKCKFTVYATGYEISYACAEAYARKLNELRKLSSTTPSAGIILADMNGDGVKELLFSPRMTTVGAEFVVYTFKNNKVVRLGSCPTGLYETNNRTQYAYFMMTGVGMGHYGFVTFSGNSIIRNEKASYAQGRWFAGSFNSKDVSKSQFDSRKKTVTSKMYRQVPTFGVNINWTASKVISAANSTF